MGSKRGVEVEVLDYRNTLCSVFMGYFVVCLHGILVSFRESVGEADGQDFHPNWNEWRVITVSTGIKEEVSLFYKHKKSLS